MNNDKNINNYKKRKILKYIIIVICLIMIILSILCLLLNISFVYPLILLVIEILLNKYRDNLIVNKK